MYSSAYFSHQWKITGYDTIAVFSYVFHVGSRLYILDTERTWLSVYQIMCVS